MRLRLFSGLSIFLASLSLVNCAPLGEESQSQPEAVLVRPAAPPLPTTTPPVIHAESAMVIDAMTGRILAAKDPDSRRAVASIQKLLTAIVVLDAGSLDKKVTIAAIDGSVEPTKLYLKPGEVYTRRELLKVILVKSANDASMALARDVAGSKEAFAARMNARARSLGMMNSKFQNPHGLTEPDQYSTARDIALLCRAAYQYGFIRECMRIQKYTFVYNDGRTKKIESTNKVLKRVPYANGMKTGTTNAAGRCLAASGALNGRVVISVVLKSTTPNIWNDSEKLLRWALESGAPASN